MSTITQTLFSTDPATLEETKIIGKKIDDFNNNALSFTGKDVVPNNYVVKVENTIIAGVISSVYLEEVLYVGVLFVEKTHRNKRLGTILLKRVEDEAKAMGARIAHLDTFDFQAKDFYIKHGYEIFGVLEDCPHGHKRYYLKKRL